MQPRLIAVSGPLAGQTFPLGTERLTLGRDHGNAVHLRDLAVSRHHCVVEPDGERFRLRDLDSRCGTFVNGVPVRERDLEHWDRIKLGDSPRRRDRRRGHHHCAPGLRGILVPAA